MFYTFHIRPISLNVCGNKHLCECNTDLSCLGGWVGLRSLWATFWLEVTSSTPENLHPRFHRWRRGAGVDVTSGTLSNFKAYA